MSLERQVKEFAERARQILLAQAAAQESKEGKGKWQGYGSDGRGQVKKDGEIKPVNLIGEISLPENQDVFVDETNTVEIQKRTPRSEPIIPRPGPTVLIKGQVTEKRPVFIDEDEAAARPNFIPFYVVRWNDSSFNVRNTPRHPIPGPQLFSRQNVTTNGVSTTFSDARVTLDFRGRDDSGFNTNSPENTLLIHHTRYSNFYTEDEQRQFFMAARNFLNTQPNAMGRQDIDPNSTPQQGARRNVGPLSVGSDMTNIVFLMANTWLPLYSNIGSQQPGGTGVPSNSPWADDGVPAVLETHITSPGTPLPYSAQTVGFMVGHCILATDDFENWQMEINDGDSSQFGNINPMSAENLQSGNSYFVRDSGSTTFGASVDHTTQHNTFNSNYNNVNINFTHTYP